MLKYYFFFDKVPEEKNYNKVSIDEEAVATLDAELLLQKNKKIYLLFLIMKKYP